MSISKYMTIHTWVLKHWHMKYIIHENLIHGECLPRTMSVSRGLNAGKIECLVSRLVDDVWWLGVFARDKLPDLNRGIWPSCLILSTDPTDQPGTHWLSLYAPSASSIELWNSFGNSPSMYRLDFFRSFAFFLFS